MNIKELALERANHSPGIYIPLDDGKKTSTPKWNELQETNWNDSRWETAEGYGVRTDDLVVIDVDEVGCYSLIEQLKQLSDYYYKTSAPHKYHFHFLRPDDYTPDTNHVFGEVKCGHKHYVALPGSKNKDDIPTTNGPSIVLPDKLIEFLTTTPGSRKKLKSPAEYFEEYPLTPGDTDNLLFKYACYLRGKGALNEHNIFHELINIEIINDPEKEPYDEAHFRRLAHQAAQFEPDNIEQEEVDSDLPVGDYKLGALSKKGIEILKGDTFIGWTGQLITNWPYKSGYNDYVDFYRECITIPEEPLKSAIGLDNIILLAG